MKPLLLAMILFAGTSEDKVVKQYQNIQTSLTDKQLTDLMMSNFVDCAILDFKGTVTVKVGRKKAEINCQDLKQSYDEYEKSHSFLYPDAPAKKSVDPTV